MVTFSYLFRVRRERNDIRRTSKITPGFTTQNTSELKTLEMDTLYPDRKISVSTVHTFDVLLNPLFWISLLGYPKERIKRQMRESSAEIPNLFFSVSDWLFSFYNRHSDWFQFRYSGRRLYQYIEDDFRMQF